MAESDYVSQRAQVREFVDRADGVALVGVEESEAIAEAAFSRYFSSDTTARGIPGISFRSWRYDPDTRADILEILTTRCEADVVLILWDDDDVVLEGVRGRCQQICSMVEEFQELRFLVVGPEKSWVIADTDRGLTVCGFCRLGRRSFPRHFGWAALIGLVVAAIALSAAWMEYGYRTPTEPRTLWAFLDNEYAQDSILVGAFAGGMASCLSLYVFRRSRPSVFPRPAQLTVGIVVTTVASLGVALLLAMAYDFHLQAQSSGH